MEQNHGEIATTDYDDFSGSYDDLSLKDFQEGGKQASVGDQVAETLHWDLSVEADAGGKIGLFFTIIK